MDTEKARLLALRKKIDELSYQYYTFDKPTVTDYEYDMMYRELENIEKAHPDWVTPDSPTQRVGSKISGGFEKYTHDRPMLSLGDVFSDDELRDSVRFTVTARPRTAGNALKIGVYADGEDVLALDEGKSVEIARSAKTAKLIELEGYDPYDVLARKLGWSGSNVK